MAITSHQATNYLIGAQVAALVTGYMLKAPDLQATAQRQADIRHQATEAAFDQQEAIARAQRCTVLMTEIPISDGTAAYFSSVRGGQIVIDKKRPMPNGTPLCDTFGNTGVVNTQTDGTPRVTDIRRLPPEQMTEILQQRGVLPHKNTRPIKTEN